MSWHGNARGRGDWVPAHSGDGAEKADAVHSQYIRKGGPGTCSQKPVGAGSRRGPRRKERAQWEVRGEGRRGKGEGGRFWVTTGKGLIRYSVQSGCQLLCGRQTPRDPGELRRGHVTACRGASRWETRHRRTRPFWVWCHHTPGISLRSQFLAFIFNAPRPYSSPQLKPVHFPCFFIPHRSFSLDFQENGTVLVSECYLSISRDPFCASKRSLALPSYLLTLSKSLGIPAETLPRRNLDGVMFFLDHYY